MTDFIQVAAFGYCLFLVLFCTVRGQQLSSDIRQAEFILEHHRWEKLRRATGNDVRA